MRMRKERETETQTYTDIEGGIERDRDRDRNSRPDQTSAVQLIITLRVPALAFRTKGFAFWRVADSDSWTARTQRSSACELHRK